MINNSNLASNYQSPLSELDSDYGSLSIESQQQMSGPASATNAGPMAMQQRSEEYLLLNQLLSENAQYPCFGFILDRNGTIEICQGNVEQFFGLSAAQLENQKLMSFVSPKHRQKICSLLPSANTNSTRKQTEIEFISEKTRQTFTLQVLSQAVYTAQLAENNVGKRPCVICVAKQTVNESNAFPQTPAFNIFLERKTRRIIRIDFIDNKFNLNSFDFVGHSIETFFDQNDRTVLDTLIDSPSIRCSGKLSFSIQNKTILVVVSKYSNGDETIVLECAYNQGNVDSSGQLGIVQERKPLELPLSDRNFNYQQQTQLFSPTNHAKNYQFQTADSTAFNYQSFQATQQPQLQSSATNSFESINEEIVSPTKRKPRKPRKPRNSQNLQTAKNEQAEATDNVSHQLDCWSTGNTISAGTANYLNNADGVPKFLTQNHVHLTGQPYPAPMGSYQMAYNPQIYNQINESPSFLSNQPVNSEEPEIKTPKKRQRNTKRNNNRNTSKQKDEVLVNAGLVGMYQNQAAGSASNSTFSGLSVDPSTSSPSISSTYSSQPFQAGRTTMSSSLQVANGYPVPHQINVMPQQHHMQAMYNNPSMNGMPMNGLPYHQMNSMANGQAAWAQQNNAMMNNGQTPNEFHPMYHQQAQMQQMMYNQQQANMGQSNMPINTSQTPPSTKKAGAKRKNTQQSSNAGAPGRSNKQAAPFMANSMQPNAMQSNAMQPNNMPSNGILPAQHYQQFPQSNNPMYNPALMGQPNMQHVAQINQQQQMLAQQQMMANGSPQFSSPTTPINHVSPYPNNVYGQKSSEAVRIELRNTLQTRQNANSPSSQPNSQPQNPPMPHSVASSTMTSEMNGMRFPQSNESMPNLLSSPRMTSNQPMMYNGMQQSNQQNGMKQEKFEIRSEYLLSDFDLDQKSLLSHAGEDSLHIDTQFYDFGLFSGRFDLENDEETRVLVQKLLD